MILNEIDEKTARNIEVYQVEKAKSMHTESILNSE